MEFKQFALYWITLASCTLLTVGCQQRSEPDAVAVTPPEAETSPSTQQAVPPDHLSTGRRMLLHGHWDAAADEAQKALVQDPGNVEATLLLCEIEAARGNHEAAAELAGGISLDSRLAARAVKLQVRALVKLDRISDAAEVLLRALDAMPNQTQWRHQAWALLGRVGRRQEASHQAETLCRAGQVTRPELASLVRRNDSFPAKLKDKEDPNKYFEPGLGMARWYFTQLDYRTAIEELATERESGFRSAAAVAFYGRLLTETQALEQVPAWHANCNLSEVEKHGDYWAALGTYFFDSGHYEASARALLEAVRRNPTDRLSVQRLARTFDALGRSDEGEQFRLHGVALAQTERTAAKLGSSTGYDAPKKLMRQVMELGRPFETLAWTLQVMPETATARRSGVVKQREELLRTPAALAMAAESSLLGVDPTEFSVEPARTELLSSKSDLPKTRTIEVEPIARPRLVNVAGEVGLDFQWYKDFEIDLASIPIHESVGGGIAVLDYDLDGWPDVYLSQGSGEPPSDECTRSNELTRNLGGRFIKVTPLAAAEDFNFGAGLAAGDVNQDGFADLYLGSLGHNRLLINNGDGTFRDTTNQLGEVEDRFTSSLAIADINGDALPDLFEGIYIEMEGAFKLPEIGEDGREVQPSPLKHYAQSDRWFQNMGDGRFQLREIPREVARPGTSLGLIVTDFDRDGSNEVFVGNDVRANHYLVQSADNQLLNRADAVGVANGLSGAANGCMGIAAGDFNHDGELDLHITNFNLESANLYLQTSGGGFADRAVRYGLDQVSLPYVGFGTKAIDLDRDTWLDLIVTNGHIFDMRQYGEGFQMPPQCLMSHGNRFVELASVDDDSGYWQKSYLGRSMAMLDFDRSGAMDLLINHLDQPLALLHNQTETPGRWVQFELAGTTSERDAIGARVVVTCGDGQFTGWVTAGDGYYCGDEAVVDFGIGTLGEIANVEVHWPSGRQQSFGQLECDRRYLIVENASEPYLRW